MRALVLALLLWPGALPALGPGEALDDPGLEARARALSAELRCPICRNESIDDSGAGVARDIRLLVRERLLAGDTDREVLAHVEARYGEFILLRPSAEGANLLLWAAGPLMLALAFGLAFATVRGRARAAEPALSAEEEARLRRLLDR